MSQETSAIEKGIEKVKEMIGADRTGADELDFEEQVSGIKLKYPKHLAMTMEGIVTWSRNDKVDLKEAYRKSFVILKNILKIQVKENITILTVLVLPASYNKEGDLFPVLVDALTQFLNEMKEDPLVHKNQIKISALGKWYDMPGRLVDNIKDITNETRDYDSFFLNLCINYNGQEEIVDAFRLIGRQVKSEKVDPELVSREMVKENLYSSYFIPPDLIIKTCR